VASSFALLGLLMAACSVWCWPECWSLGRVLVGATNIQTLCAGKDLKESWPNVGVLVCWSFQMSVFVKKGVRKKKKPKRTNIPT
jgi:hypothetical protein